MPDAITDKSVFIDEMPDYQQAMRALKLLSERAAASEAVGESQLGGQLKKNGGQHRSSEPFARELGLDKELGKTKTDLNAANVQVQSLLDAEKKLSTSLVELSASNASKSKRAAIAGVGVAAGGGVAAGIMGGKRWGSAKGVLIGLATALVTGAVWLAVTFKILNRPTAQAVAYDREYDVLQAQENKLGQNVTDIQQQFMAEIATKMLSERKELVGQGADTKLVSNAEPFKPESSTSPNMSAKHAISPTVTHVDSVMRSQNSIPHQR